MKILELDTALLLMSQLQDAAGVVSKERAKGAIYIHLRVGLPGRP